MNRCLDPSAVFMEQKKGNYNQIHDIISYTEIYTDLSWTYTDSSNMYTVPEHYKTYESLMLKYEMDSTNDEDELFLPFSLVYHTISGLDSLLENDRRWYTVNKFHVIPIISQNNMFLDYTFKSCSIMDMYPDNGYSEGYLRYEPQLISFSSDMSDVKLEIDFGNGFQAFNENNTNLKYSRINDSVIGKLAISFYKNGNLLVDTLSFYVTTNIDEKSANKSKSNTWDYVSNYNNTPEVKIRYGVKRGCGNEGKKFRRPIIIIPPYRPAVQLVSMDNYFDQFNYGGLIDELSARGYDVIFVKLRPGYESLELSGGAVAKFISYINWKKHDDYPNENWENIVMGYSMGGQITRYALKKLEKEHMDDWRNPHPHSRLYIPFDSPHLGANIPMFTQAVYYDLRNKIFQASEAFESLTDGASKDMGTYNITNSNLTHGGGNNYYIYPAPAVERNTFINALENDFNHQFTPMNDLRRSYPVFTRNIAISTGNNDQDYQSEFSLNPGELLFEQNLSPGTGSVFKTRKVRASLYGPSHSAFKNLELLTYFGIPIPIRNRDYKVEYGYEWDLAQGGYKDEFWDKNVTGVTSILRCGSPLGTKHYNKHMSFLPLVSALGINPTIWQNNNLYYNIKEQGLMYQNFNFNPNTDKSDLFGYPHLAHPTNHFQITPFEAVYCDPLTYEHIKLEQSVTDNDYTDGQTYLNAQAKFIADEVEAENVYLQNKIIGDNHIQGVGFIYKAWYKAKSVLTIGNSVTPKTDLGDFIIESSGNITTYAGTEINLKPGFQSLSGSTFHAYIQDECWSNSGLKSMNSANDDSNKFGSNSQINETTNKINEVFEEILIHPNPSSGEITVSCLKETFFELTIYNALGQEIKCEKLPVVNGFNVTLAKGVYIFRTQTIEGKIETHQIIVL
jgi:hypothetical protein